MDYYINDYSLRGQFKDVDDFFSSLREFTLPILKKIDENNENVIWKKDTLWQSEICNGITLSNIPQKKNERNSEQAALKIALIKLMNNDPYWSECDEIDVKINEYKFDEEYRDRFLANNCFTEAIKSEGTIVSFIHNAYKSKSLEIRVHTEQGDKDIFLDNIFTVEWWRHEPKIRTWRIENRYVIEIRANEFSYHPPHFHVSQNEYAAVFGLKDGKLYINGKKHLQPKFLYDIYEWYNKNCEELKNAWNELHPELPY
jgi:hypothetical protein